MTRFRVGLGTTVFHRGNLSSGIDGIGHYTKALADSLVLSKGVKLVPFIFGSKCAPGDYLTPYQLPSFGFSELSALLLGRSTGGCEKFSENVDLIHATDHLIPKCKTVPVVATIMDAIPLVHPEWIDSRWASVKNNLWKKTASFADHVITISEHSKTDVIRYFGLPEKCITVIPLGVDQHWYTKLDALTLNDIRMRYQLPKHFFVFVGTLQPRKNLARLIDAHRALPNAVRARFPLIVVGRSGWRCQEVISRFRHDDVHVRWLRYVPSEDMPGILQCAFALVFPSLYEGFGLPVLEAFASDLPVITSNTTCLPEVAGDAALLVDPLKVKSISDAMISLTQDVRLLEHLRRKGSARAKDFTWTKNAAATLGVYRRFGLRDA